MIIDNEMTPEEKAELDNYTELQDNGYVLENSAHELIKGDESSEVEIWSKDGTPYIGNSIATLKPFNGYTADVYVKDKKFSIVTIDYDGNGYSIEEVTKDIEEWLGHSDFEII